jgi:hypothetical protein
MPPCTPGSPPDPSDIASDVRQRAHSALSSAIVARPRPGSASRLPAELRVNLSLFTDALRAVGVPIDVGRGERPAHYGRPAAAERAAGAAPFGSGSRVRLRANVTVYELERCGGRGGRHVGVVQSVHQKQDGAWLAEVTWENGHYSPLFDCTILELDEGPSGVPAMARAVDELAAAAEADAEAANQRFARQLFADSPPSMSGRLARGEKRPAWWGEPPAPGTRRKLIGDVLRAEDVLSESEIREFADAIELALTEVEAKVVVAEGKPIKHRTLTQVDEDLRRMDREVIDAGNELDRVSVPREMGGPSGAAVCSLPERVRLLVQRYLGHRTTVDALVEGDVTAQGLLAAAQKLPEEDYRLLERALAWDVEDIGALPDEFEPKPESIALTERSGRRIARALETLTTSAGGALRELLDRTATDREAR